MKTENPEPLYKDDTEMMEESGPQFPEEDADFHPEDESDAELLDDQEILEGVSTEDPMRMYLKEIGSIPLLSSDEERELARKSAEGDTEAREKLIDASLRLPSRRSLLAD